MYTRRVRILLIDDDEDDYIITRDLLDDLQAGKGNGRFIDDFGFDLDWVDNYEDGLNSIKLCQHEVYLIDYRLGEMDGLMLMRQGMRLSESPFILLTGQGDREIDVEAMRVGAADYLVKGSIDATLLERSIRYAIERKNAERIRQRLEEQLRHAQKMEAIGRLAGGIAHDFNNSLTIIMTCSQLIQREKQIAPKLHEYAYEIERAGQQAFALTRQLLAISRNQKLQPRLINLNELIIDLKQILRRALGSHIEMITITRQQTSTVKADPSQLEQVIMNLVLNARDAMPNGGKVIVETDRKYLDQSYTNQYIGLEPGLYTSLTVSDTGDGIAPEVLPHIFEPFFTTKENKGTGLGLATVYGIVQQSGGQIRVYSEIGLGTVFKIYLPLPSDTVDTPVTEAENKEETAGLPLLGTILVVDDDPKVCQLLVELFKNQGHIVLNAGSAAEALHLVQTHQQSIDLLITDIVLPDNNGRELAQLIHKQKPQIKVIFMSGYTRNVLNHHNLLEDNAVFMDKPLEINHLLRMVQQSLA
jgi:two-component system, cell cycle sensor histidine kinase and response regulator CckA